MFAGYCRIVHWILRNEKIAGLCRKGDKKCTNMPVQQAFKTIIICQILPEKVKLK
jgi:hypothetical protein